jgi:hypothetical protein
MRDLRYVYIKESVGDGEQYLFSRVHVNSEAEFLDVIGTKIL